MKDFKLDRKRKLSVDDGKKSYKRKTSEETNSVNSSSKDYKGNQIDLNLNNLNYIKEDTASTSYSCKKASKPAKPVSKKDTNYVNKNIFYFKNKNECLICSKNLNTNLS